MKIIVRSRNKSANLIKDLDVPCKTILRLGSVTEKPTDKDAIEINSAYGCYISNDKHLMKQKFNNIKIQQSEWFHSDNNIDNMNLKYPIICKYIHSSGGKGIYLFKTKQEVESFLKAHPIDKYVFEHYYTYTKEYRLHVSTNGCFLSYRKLLKNGQEDRWHRHINNSTFINEANELFSKPTNWDTIVDDCMKILQYFKLDIAAFDVKVQNKKKNPKYIILESNTAPSITDFSCNIYKQELMNIINKKRADGKGKC